ncbi:hypothetical protein RN347_04530 [Halomonas sp. PAMB 3264]|uniref:hypothetical protein n=1 Tax=Halomonas sp. PAMB 3264 TaxID=3075222 RepID=UPI0028985B85|nr:hypothetical protein [Halomonas sp. PAMB 3264]WNL43169.1 hypothetical protein RN347_04530 [Halomonas sp. PAMB 3264]
MLNLLSESDRVWVNIPRTGYVGVAEVTGERVRADEFMVETVEGLQRLKAVITPAEYPHLHQASSMDDEDTLEYIVPVRWIKSVPVTEAFREVGLFGNQNTVCKPTTPKWEHTVERLKQAWSVV